MTFKNLESDQQVNLPSESETKPLGQTEPAIVVNVRKSNAYIMLGKQEPCGKICLLAIAQ